MTSTNLLLIDDHPIVLEGMRVLLQARMPKVLTFTHPTLSAGLASGITPDLVGLDIMLPGINGLDGIALVREKWPNARVFMLSSQYDASTQAEAFARGAIAFVAKDTTSAQIVGAIQTLVQGDVPLTDEGAFDANSLTRRQFEVLELLHQGLSNKAIAYRLEITDNTVRRHLQHIFNYLGVASRTEASFEARRRGLVT